MPAILLQAIIQMHYTIKWQEKATVNRRKY